MDQQYGSSVHMSHFSMQPPHHQHSTGQHHYPSHGQYQQLYSEYPESCYQSSPFHDATYHGDQYGYHSTASVPYGTGIESYLDPKYASNPAAFASRLPYLPFHAAAVAAYGMYDYSFEPAFIRKRNERERQRVKCVNEGYARLREHLPEEYAEKRLSKVETLRGAIMYIKQLQSILGFDPDKSSKVKKLEQESSTGPEKSENNSNRRENSENSGAKSSAIEERVITPQCHASMDDDNFSELVTKIELDTDELVKSPYKNKAYSKRKDDANQSRMTRGNNANSYSPCMTSNHARTNSRSSIESPRFCAHEYSPKAITSPTPPINGERNIPQKSCAVAERSSCLDSDLIENTAALESSDVGRQQCDWWDRVCNKSQMNAIFDLVDDCPLNASKHLIQSHPDNNGWVNKSSRHHPYKRLDLRNSALSDNWDDVFQIKVETHTPPPYDERSEFSCQQQYSSCQRVFTKARQNLIGSNDNDTTKGAQSDGFKTDTSPESLTGLSP